MTIPGCWIHNKSGDEPRFLIVLDTHLANLDGYDFKTLGILRDDTGKVYSPTAIENKGSGHHREATVSFPKLSQEARRVELVIKDVAGVKERVFRWTVDKTAPELKLAKHGAVGKEVGHGISTEQLVLDCRHWTVNLDASVMTGLLRTRKARAWQ